MLVRARALENQLTVAYANHTGGEEGYDFRGGSIVAGPDGTVLAAAGTGAELLFAELGPTVDAAAAGADGTDRPADGDNAVAYLRDRRPGPLPFLGDLTGGSRELRSSAGHGGAGQARRGTGQPGCGQAGRGQVGAP